jgi:hypothetical protein
MIKEIRIDKYCFAVNFIQSCKTLESFLKHHPKYPKDLLEDVYYMVHEKKVKK